MNEKMSPEQIDMITKAVEEHIKATGQNVSTQQLLPSLLAILDQLPATITQFIVQPVGGATVVLTNLLNALIGVLTGAIGLMAGSGLTPNLVNIIKEQVPTQQPVAGQQFPPKE